jgi:AcrR family transcriptional regulator
MTIVLDRHEQRKQETHQRLLDAAEQVFSRLGYEAASVLDITEAANLSKRTFYLHFADKEALIEALALRGFIELRQQAEAEEQAHDDEESFREGLYKVARLIFEYAQSRPALMQIIFGQNGSYRLQAMARVFMTQAWEDNINRKCIFKPDAPVPPQIMANAIAGLVFQLMCWWTQHPNDYTPDEMAQMYVSLVCDGVGVNFIMQSAALA